MVIDQAWNIRYQRTKKLSKQGFEKVLKKYEAISTQTCTQNSDSTKTKHKENPPSIVERYFLEIKGKISSSHKKSELALYLSEPRILFANNFNVLTWWKENQIRFPILAKVAKDWIIIVVFTIIFECKN